MKVTFFRFTAKQLRRIHSDHLGFILASSHCCNELTAVMPYIIFEHDVSTANEAERTFIEMRTFTLIRFNVGKIFEYRVLCDKYIERLTTTFPAMADEVAELTRPISRRINEARWAKTLRDKIGFHFDANYMLESLEHVSDSETLNFIAGSTRGVTAFYFADRTVISAMFREAGDSDEQRGQQVMKDWTIGLGREISRLHNEIVIKLFERDGLFSRREEGEIRDDKCAVPGDLCIPLATMKRA